MIAKNTARFVGQICKEHRSQKKSSIITALLMDPEKSVFTVGKKIVSSNGNVRIAEKNGSGRIRRNERAVFVIAAYIKI
jgi:hypothetical protein